MASNPVRYRSLDEDSARWLGFEHRDGDIVISTRSKSGTTWVQMICALLVFGTSELPKPLPELSPWLVWLVVSEDAVKRSLAHRLDIEIEAAAIDDLAAAASFDSMKAGSDMLAPDPAGVLEERSAFFRRGSSGGAKLVLGAPDLAAYHARAASLAPGAFLEWLHRP